MPTTPSQSTQNDFQFAGFLFPTTTAVPDEIFDTLLSKLTGAELKVLLYICRRTYGFKKSSDDISLSQIVRGIQTKQGEVLDRGTGLNKSTVVRVLGALEEKKIIVRRRNSSVKRGNEPTTYALNFVHTPLVQNETRAGSTMQQGLAPTEDTQQTAKQDTARQPALADQLVKFGLAKSTAKKLVNDFSEERIQEKIDFLRFYQTHKPGKIISPNRWLRSAIKDDYEAPDGYQSRADLAHKQAKKEEMAKLVSQQQAKLKAEVKAAADKKSEMEKAVLAKLEERFETNQQIKTLWQDVLEELHNTTSQLNYKLAKGVHLLTINDNVAIFAASNSFSIDQIRRSIGVLLVEMFAVRGYEVLEMEALILSDHAP